MAKDYYEILGVKKDATTEDIKRAYRKLAHQHHPDKSDTDGGAKFKEINEAYQVLSDEKKRAQYDQFGSSEGSPFGGGWQGNYGNANSAGWDFGDLGGFSSGGFSARGGFGNLGDIFEGIFGQAYSQVQTEIEISLTQALLGGKLELQTTDGENIVLDIPTNTEDGTTFRFRGKGRAHKRGRGDLLITVRVHWPRRLSREQKEILEKLRQTGL